MITLRDTRRRMSGPWQHAMVALFDFVDEFRRRPAVDALVDPFQPSEDEEGRRLDALAASTAERLCADAAIEPPCWLSEVPPCRDPWFVAGVESLKAITIVESPAHFRARKIFVLGNFLDRV